MKSNLTYKGYDHFNCNPRFKSLTGPGRGSGGLFVVSKYCVKLIYRSKKNQILIVEICGIKFLIFYINDEIVKDIPDIGYKVIHAWRKYIKASEKGVIFGDFNDLIYLEEMFVN